MAAGACGKAGLDIVLLAQTEVGEAHETGEGRGGSSTMPHKRNPVAAVAAIAAPRRAPGLVATMLAVMPQEHERAAGGWQAEWETLPALLRGRPAGGGRAARVARAPGGRRRADAREPRRSRAACRWPRRGPTQLTPALGRAAAARAGGGGVPASGSRGRIARRDAGRRGTRRRPRARALPRGSARARRRGAAGTRRPRANVTGCAIELHHEVTGPADAPAVVLSNSLGATLAMWDRQLDALAGFPRRALRPARTRRLAGAADGPNGSPTWAATWSRCSTGSRSSAPRWSASRSAAWSRCGRRRTIPTRVDRLVPCFTSAQLGPPRCGASASRRCAPRARARSPTRSSARWFTPAFAAREPGRVAGMRDDHRRHARRRLRRLLRRDRAHGPARRSAAHHRAHARDRRRGRPSTPPEHAERDRRRHPRRRPAGTRRRGPSGNIEQPEAVNAPLLGHLQGGIVMRPRPRRPARAARGAGRRARRSRHRRRHRVLGPFQEFITRAAWGDVWARPGLERRERSLVTLAALVSLRAEGELALHVRAAARNGLTPDEIGEAILHTALYAGLPAANAAFKIAERVLVEDGLLPGDRMPPR